ncbi:MAG TPA: FtsX-like permease family protein [Rubrivivax sp.]|nr:FtsX-like permease family protein [Rubrivivax sp.]
MSPVVLACRNLIRNRRRSTVTLFAMALGLTTVLLFGGYVRDIKYAMQTDFVRRTGHLQVQHKDFFLLGSGNPAAYGIEGYEAIVGAIRDDPVLGPLVKEVAPVLQFGGIAGNFSSGASRTAMITGIVPDEQNRMRQWNDYGQRVQVRPLTLQGSAPDSVVLGVGLARVLDLCGELKVPDCLPAAAAKDAASGAAAAKDGSGTLPADIADLASSTQAAGARPERGVRMELLASGPKGAPNVASVTPIGAEFQGIKELDEIAVVSHLALAQRLVYGSTAKQVTAIAVQLHHTADLVAAQERLARLFAERFPAKPLAVVDFGTLNPFYGQTIRMFDSIFGFISALIGGIVLFTVTNTMSMMVVERTVEIGTLRAIGLRRTGVRRMFVLEAVVLGLAAAAAGILSSLLLAWMVNRMNLEWTPPTRIEPVPLSIGLGGEYLMMLSSAAALVLVAVASAFVPAARASKMNIVDALRHV